MSEEIKPTDLLEVFIEGNPVGTITRSTGMSMRFQYDKNWLQSGFPISISLPLQTKLFGEEVSTNYFDNLLPETVVRQKVTRQSGVSERDIFALLKLLGQDCAGAVTIFSPDRNPEASGIYQDISIQDLGAIITNLSTQPLGTKDNEIRLSLAGAQEKLAIFYESGNFKIPQNGAPSTHILKPAIHDYQGTVVNEYYCMQLARRVGLDVPACEVLTVFSEPVYLIERFDRFFDNNGKRRRVPQEDFCQASGIEANRKYEADGGPSFIDCYRLLESHSIRRAQDGLMLIDWLLFNFIIGNSDAHAKNIALLSSVKGHQLAPFYDILSTTIYPQLTSHMAIGISGKRDPDRLFPVHFQRLAESLGVKLRLVTERAEQLISNIEVALPEMSKSVREFSDGEWVETQIRKIIVERSRVLKALLSI